MARTTCGRGQWAWEQALGLQHSTVKVARGVPEALFWRCTPPLVPSRVPGAWASQTCVRHSLGSSPVVGRPLS